MKNLAYLLCVVFALGLGSCGKDGSTGPAGQQGERGVAGAAGEKGLDGRTILSGTSNPASGVGAVGDFYINTNSYLIYGPKTASGWGSGESILGSTGATGATGARGAAGAKGDKGDKGDAGARGAAGAKGDKGDKGDTGATGARGAAGAKGDKGDKGEAEYVILSGLTPPANSLGKDKDFYFDFATKTLYYKFVNWQLVAKLAKTMQFTKTGFDMPATPNTSDGFVFNFPREVLEKSMITVYTRVPNAIGWYPLPGYVGNSTNEFRIFFSNAINSQGQVDPNRTRFNISKVQGMTAYLNSEIRIVVMEADVFHSIAQKVDFGNYNDISNYFQLGN